MTNVQISDEELLEVSHAFQILQKFLDKIVSPNDLYTEEFLNGLDEAGLEVQRKEFSEVKDLADFSQ